MSDTSFILTISLVAIIGIIGSRISVKYQIPKTIILILFGIIIGDNRKFRFNTQYRYQSY